MIFIGNAQSPRKCFTIGDDGYLTKESISKRLNMTIKKIILCKCINPFLAEKLAFDCEADAAKQPYELCSE